MIKEMYAFYIKLFLFTYFNKKRTRLYANNIPYRLQKWSYLL